MKDEAVAVETALDRFLSESRPARERDSPLGNRVRESGGVPHVPAAYCVHRSAAGFASDKTGNK
jgi:hypothetical protein